MPTTDSREPLAEYGAKRNFSVTAEPTGRRGTDRSALTFVVQKHAASHLHYDFRLELDGVLLSWAVPKGPSLDPSDKRMAIHVEDHPLSYATFEGTIAPKQYGAGTVIVWDNGRWDPVGDPHETLTQGKLKFRLHGKKLAGTWELIKIAKGGERQEPWLLSKKRDEFARPRAEYDVLKALPDSVLAKPTPKARLRETSLASPMAVSAPVPLSSAKFLVKITHGERIIDASTGLIKLDLVRYYDRVAEWILPHLKGRACSLVRGPDGVSGELFFQKHAERVGIPGVKELDPVLWPDHAGLLEVATRKALIGSAQMNVIEFHTWNTTTRNIDKPDRMVFDLDPGAGTDWEQVQEAASQVRAFLEELGLKSWLKTSGGKGLHVVVPLAPRLAYGTVKGFSQAVVQHLAQVSPTRFVAKSGASNRVGKLFVDYLRNGEGATTAAAYSARARPGLGVSMPVSWEDLPSLKSGAHWTISTAVEHLLVRKVDPWADYKARKQTLTGAMKTIGFQSRTRAAA